MPEISVIVPAYNVEEQIEKCVNSILCQSFKDFELIVVNDGSTDRTGEVCDYLKSLDERIIIIHQINSGVSAARNTGIDKSKGNYIVFVDSDDYIDVDFFEKLYAIKSDLTMCGFIGETVKGKLLYSVRHDFVHYGARSQIDYGKLYEENFLYSPCCKLLSSEIIKSHDLRFPQNVNWGEDAIFIADYLQCVESIVVLDYTGYHYVKNEHENSLSTLIREDIVEMIERSRLYCIAKMEVISPECTNDVELACSKDIKMNCAYFVRRLLNNKGIRLDKKKKILHKYMESAFVKETFEQCEIFYFGRKDYSVALSKKSPTAILWIYNFEQYKKIILTLFYKCWIVYKKITDRK